LRALRPAAHYHSPADPDHRNRSCPVAPVPDAQGGGGISQERGSADAHRPPVDSHRNVMRAHLAVVGSLNVDVTIPVEHLPVPGETVLASAPSRVAFGGKGGNQAAAAAAMGAAVCMIGRVGADEHGRQILHDLARQGIDTSATAVTAGARTGSATI